MRRPPRRVARWLASSFLLSVVTVDAAFLLAIAGTGLFLGYGRVVDAVWTWRREHLLPALVVSFVLLVLVRGLRAMLSRDGREPGRLLCRVGLHRWESREGYARGWWETWNRCVRVECRYSGWMRVGCERGDRNGASS